MDYSKFFSAALTRLHDERRYRVFADLERIAGRFPHAVWHSPKGPRNVVIHLGLCLEPDRHLDDRQADSELPDPVGCAES